MFAESEGFLAGRPQGLGVGVGVGEGDFEQGAQAGEGGAQLVGGVGDEVSLGVEGGFEAGEEVVEGVAEFGELVLWAVEAEARWRLPAEISRAAAVIVRRGRRKRPAIYQANAKAIRMRRWHDHRCGVDLVAEEGVVGAGAAVGVGGALPDEQAADGEDGSDQQAKMPA